MTVLGIDPGTGRCGYGVVSFASSVPQVITSGCFEYPSSMPIPERLVRIEADLNNVLDATVPTLCAIETLIFNRNITTAMQVAEARGVVSLCAAKRGIAIQNCSPSQVKMAVTGYGRADKTQIKQMVTMQLKLDNTRRLDDTIDALAIAITGYHLSRMPKL